MPKRVHLPPRNNIVWFAGYDPYPLATTVAGQSAVSAGLAGMTQSLAATVAAQSAVSPTLTPRRGLEASPAGVAAVVAVLTIPRTLAAAVAARSGTAGAVTVVRGLAAAVGNLSEVSADLTAVGIYPALAAVVAAEGGISAALGTDTEVSGEVDDLRPAYWINVESASGVAYGDGPIVTARRWQSVARLDRAGTFSFEMPASDPRAALLVAKRRVRCFGLVGGVLTEIGAGIIDKIEVKFGSGGLTLTVSGDDLLRELTQISVAFLELTDGSGGGLATALAAIMAYAPSGWSLDTTNGYATTGTTPYGSFAGETVLAALGTVVDQTGQHFRLSSGRSVAWLRDDLTDSGIRAIRPEGDYTVEDNSDVAIIQDLSRSQDSYSVITRIYPYGAGNGQARLTLEATTRSPAAGYVLGYDAKGWHIKNTAAEASYGRIEAFVSFKEVSAVSNTEADLESAANALYDAAFEYLSLRIAPEQAYSIMLLKSDTVLYPGQTIRVIWREVVDGYVVEDIDADLVVLETTTQIDAAGLRTVGLQVSTVDKWPESDTEVVAEAMAEASLMDAHPQTAAGYYSRGFSDKTIDADNSAVFRFRLDDRITRLISAKLRFRTDVFEATATGASSQAVTISTATADSQAVTISTATADSETIPLTTTQGGQPHNHEITVYGGPTAAAYDVFWDPDEHRFCLPDVGSGEDDGQTSSSEDKHTHGIDMPAHDHDLTIEIEPHGHDLTIVIEPHSHDLEYGIQRNSGEYPGPIGIKINGTNYTSSLGGPWGSASTSTDEVELEIADILNAGTLRQEHRVEFVCAGGQGRLVDVAVDCFVQVQAILLG